MFPIKNPLTAFAQMLKKKLLTPLVHFLLRISDSNKKRIAVVLSCALAIAVIVEPTIAHAQTGDKTTEILNNINVYATMGLRMLSAIFWPILLLIGSLLDNNMIFGGAMEDRLLSAWVEIRNLVNIIFVFILVVIALYNVLGLGQDGGPLPLGYKTIIPKFVLALIVVNFSFVAVKIVLDVANVVTGAVFALPAKTIDTSSMSAEMEKSICGKRAKEVPVYETWCESNGKFNQKAKQYFNRLDRNNIAVVYAIRYGRATELKFIREGIKDIGQLGFNVIFNLVLFVIYTVAFIALFLVLASRLVVIWIALVMSPLYALNIALPSLLQQVGGEASGIGDKLKGTIIAPITIGLAMSVGYIMLDALGADTSVDPLLPSTSLASLDPNALPTDINTLQELLLAIGSVIVIWKGVFMATDKTFVSGIVGSMKSGMESFGGWIASLPTKIQFIPVKAFNSDKEVPLSFEDLKYLKGNMMQSGISAKRATELREQFDTVPATKEQVDSLDAHLVDGKNGILNILRDLPNVLKDNRGWEKLVNYLEKSKTAQSDYGIKPEDLKKLTDNKTNPEAGYKELARILGDSNNTSKFAKDIQKIPGLQNAAAIEQKIRDATAPITKVAADIPSIYGASTYEGQDWGSGVTDAKWNAWKMLPQGVAQQYAHLDENKHLKIDDVISTETVSNIKGLHTNIEKYHKATVDAEKTRILELIRSANLGISNATEAAKMKDVIIKSVVDLSPDQITAIRVALGVVDARAAGASPPR